MLALPATDFNFPLPNWQNFSSTFGAPSVYFPPVSVGGTSGAVDVYGREPVGTSTAPDMQAQETGFCFNPFTMRPCRSPEELEELKRRLENPSGGWFDGIFSELAKSLKSMSLLFIAAALVLLGVYLMARSTPGGRTVLKAVTKI